MRGSISSSDSLRRCVLRLDRRVPTKTQRKTWHNRFGRSFTVLGLAKTASRQANSLTTRGAALSPAGCPYRKQARLVQTEEDADLDRLVREIPAGSGQTAIASTSGNPEQALAKKFAESDMRDALKQSMKDLPAEDRLLVKLYYFDNLRLREAGAVLGVHEATASRRLTRIHHELRQRVIEILIKERGWTKTETERSFAEVAQNLDADLETLLSNEGVT